MPIAAADRGDETVDLLQLGVDAGHDVLAVDHDGAVGAVAQGHVEDGTILGIVEVLAAEHGANPAAQVAGLGQVEQQVQGLVGGDVLGEIDEEVGGAARQARGAPRIGGEEVAHLDRGHLLPVRLEGLPLRGLVD